MALYWIMQPRDEFSTPPDSDGFTAYCPGAVCTQVGQWTLAYRDGQRELPPVAEVDVLMTVVGEPGSVDLLADDVSLFSTLDAASVDLDPEADGVQSELSTADGELAVVDGVLTFTPAPGYSGRSEVMYVVSDAEGLVSAPVLVATRPGRRRPLRPR